MSKFGKKVIRRHLRKMVKRAAKRRAMRRMVRRGKKVKSINKARPTDGGIMLT